MAFWNNPTEIVPKKQSSWVVLFGLNNLESTTTDKINNNKLVIAVAKSVSKPSYQLKTTQHKYLGRHEFHYPNHVIWQPIKLVFTDAYVYETGIIDNARYLRPSSYKWDNTSNKVIPNENEYQFTQRSTQMFFHQALREAGYHIPSEVQTDASINFKTATFKKDLYLSLLGGSNILKIIEFTPAYKAKEELDKKLYEFDYKLDDSDLKQIIKDSSNAINVLEKNTLIQNKVQEKVQQKIDPNLSLRKTKFNNYNFEDTIKKSGVKQAEQWDLYNPIVTDVNFGELNYEQEGLVNISVTIAYDYANLSIPETTSQKISINQIGGKLTQEFNIQNNTVRVRNSEVDEEVAKELIRTFGRTAISSPQTFDNNLKKEAQATVDISKKLGITRTTEKINIDDELKTAPNLNVNENNNNLSLALLTSQDQAQEEIKDIAEATKNVNEVVDILAQRIVAAEELQKGTEATKAEAAKVLDDLTKQFVTDGGAEDGKISPEEFKAIASFNASKLDKNEDKGIIGALEKAKQKAKNELTDLSDEKQLVSSADDFISKIDKNRAKQRSIIIGQITGSAGSEQKISIAEGAKILADLDKSRRDNAALIASRTILSSDLQTGKTVIDFKTDVAGLFEDEEITSEIDAAFTQRRATKSQEAARLIETSAVSDNNFTDEEVRTINELIAREGLGDQIKSLEPKLTAKGLDYSTVLIGQSRAEQAQLEADRLRAESERTKKLFENEYRNIEVKMNKTTDRLAEQFSNLGMQEKRELDILEAQLRSSQQSRQILANQAEGFEFAQPSGIAEEKIKKQIERIKEKYKKKRESIIEISNASLERLASSAEKIQDLVLPSEEVRYNAEIEERLNIRDQQLKLSLEASRQFNQRLSLIDKQISSLTSSQSSGLSNQARLRLLEQEKRRIEAERQTAIDRAKQRAR